MTHSKYVLAGIMKIVMLTTENSLIQKSGKIQIQFYCGVKSTYIDATHDDMRTYSHHVLMLWSPGMP